MSLVIEHAEPPVDDDDGDKPRRRTLPRDGELRAMQAMLDLLEPFDWEQRTRILTWIAARTGYTLQPEILEGNDE